MRTDRQTDRHTDRQTDRQTDTHTLETATLTLVAHVRRGLITDYGVINNERQWNKALQVYMHHISANMVVEMGSF